MEKTGLKRIPSWKTTDGQVFVDKQEANQHQKDLVLKSSIEQIILRSMSSQMSVEEIGEAIFEQRLELYGALNTYYSKRRVLK